MSAYYVLSRDRTAEEKIRRSLFIAHLRKAGSINSAKEFIALKSKEHKTANHNCWAYIIGDEAEIFHYSDAGEPSGTAGRPILNVLRRYHLTNTVAVVTRYFGGVKLGIRGLIEAYSSVVETALLKRPLQKHVKTVSYKVDAGYEIVEQLKNHLKASEADLSDFQYGTSVEFTVKLPESEKEKLESYLNELQRTNQINYRLCLEQEDGE